jgi:hypothetical protein
MSDAINWANTPMGGFIQSSVIDEHGRVVGARMHPYGDGPAQQLMMGIYGNIGSAYEALLPHAPEPDGERFERAGEVPVMRNGRREYERLDDLELTDLPAVLDTLVALQREKDEREGEERGHEHAEKKARRRV